MGFAALSPPYKTTGTAGFALRELVAQRLVLRLELREALAHRRQRRVDLGLSKTLRDMLRAIPVEGVEVEIAARAPASPCSRASPPRPPVPDCRPGS